MLKKLFNAIKNKLQIFITDTIFVGSINTDNKKHLQAQT